MQGRDAMRLSTWWVSLLVVAVLCAPEAGISAEQSRAEDEITKLADGLYLFRHKFHQAIFVTTPKGVIVTDPIAPEAAAWLKTEIQKLTDQPVRYVVYSH